jgi:hypothetical protein
MEPAEKETISRIVKAFVDVMDGNSKWHDIQADTGLSEERCKEIQNIYTLALNYLVTIEE